MVVLTVVLEESLIKIQTVKNISQTNSAKMTTSVIPFLFSSSKSLTAPSNTLAFFVYIIFSPCSLACFPPCSSFSTPPSTLFIFSCLKHLISLTCCWTSEKRNFSCFFCFFSPPRTAAYREAIVFLIKNLLQSAKNKSLKILWSSNSLILYKSPASSSW